MKENLIGLWEGARFWHQKLYFFLCYWNEFRAKATFLDTLSNWFLFPSFSISLYFKIIYKNRVSKTFWIILLFPFLFRFDFCLLFFYSAWKANSESPIAWRKIPLCIVHRKILTTNSFCFSPNHPPSEKKTNYIIQSYRQI